MLTLVFKPALFDRKVRIKSSHVRLTYALGLALALSAPLRAQGSVGSHPRVVQAIHLMDAWLESEMAYERIPGLSIGVVYDQELVWAKGFGRADVARGIPATAATPYSICSISKVFTASALLQLRDAGRVGLDDSVRKHLPWFGKGTPLPDASAVRVRHLLTHSSGLPRDFPFASWTGPDYPFPTRDEVIATLSAPEFRFPAGSQYEYSNVGMTVAGEVIAQVSGESYAAYLTKHIFGPLGMTSTFTDQTAQARSAGLAQGYSVLQRTGNRRPIPAYEVRGLAPVAGLVSTVGDMARFISWQFRALRNGEDPLLSGGTLASMHAVQFMPADSWSTAGFGYQLWKENDRSFVGHAGTCPGAQSQLLMRPQERLAVVVLSNALGVGTSRYAQRAYDVFAPAVREAQSARPTSSTERVASDLGQLVGLYQRPLGSETVVLEWQERLALLSLPAANPLSALELFEPVNDFRFRRSGGRPETAETIEFRRDNEGRMRLWRGSQYSVRVSP